ncbi:hypothetical protein DXG01_002054 [Tephrocybe rancida]|nr:hypothetical protein DXG01_002054 [Tephrocybe rancida]
MPADVGATFGRTVHAFANVYKVIEKGLECDASVDDLVEANQAQDDMYTLWELQEHCVYDELLAACSGLKEQLYKEETTTDDIDFWADMVRKGVSAARGEDTKGMKGPIIDWITTQGENLHPPLNHRQKIDRGFQHEITGKFLCPAHLDWTDEKTKKDLRSGELIVPSHNWPMFLYEGYKFDSTNPWKGLLKSRLLVMGFKHIFIAPSSIDASDEEAPTKGGNAEIHGMKKTTSASLVYTATQVQFVLSSAVCWSRTDRTTDSENFYCSLLDTLEDNANLAYIVDLLAWWDRKIFPHSRPDATVVPIVRSPLDRIWQLKAEQALELGRANGQVNSTSS